VYSSGAAITLRLIHQVFLGIALEADAVRIDPVIPARLDGLALTTSLLGRPLEVRYHVGSRGCGVRRIAVNGEAVAFRECPQVYRTGAALLPLSHLLGGPGTGPVSLDVELG
jgi:CRISPR-associated protein Csx3